MRTTLVVLLIAASAIAAAAQGLDTMPEPEGMPPPPAPDEFGAPGPRGGPPVEMWLEHLEETDPEECQRLQTLRREDPQAFRQELQQRLRRQRAMHSFREYPKFCEMIGHLPPDEREALLDRFAQGGGPKGPPDMPPEPGAGPAFGKMQKETMELVKAYRNAQAPDQKDELRGLIRANLEKQFDVRELERQKQIQRIEADLKKLQRLMEKRQKNRELIIDKRLRELTEDESLKW